MINIRYRPNIFKRSEDVREKFVFQPDMSVLDYVVLFFEANKDIKKPALKKIKVVVLGKVLQDLNKTLKDED